MEPKKYRMDCRASSPRFIRADQLTAQTSFRFWGASAFSEDYVGSHGSSYDHYIGPAIIAQ